jgi:hypothetical protein
VGFERTIIVRAKLIDKILFHDGFVSPFGIFRNRNGFIPAFFQAAGKDENSIPDPYLNPSGEQGGGVIRMGYACFHFLEFRGDPFSGRVLFQEIPVNLSGFLIESLVSKQIRHGFRIQEFFLVHGKLFRK